MLVGDLVRKLSRPAVALAAVTLLLAGCATTDEGGGGGDEGGRKAIALLLPETKTTRYEAQDRPNFERKVKELCSDCEVLYSNADQDPAKQQDQAEAAITNGAKVIVISAVDVKSAAFGSVGEPLIMARLPDVLPAAFRVSTRVCACSLPTASFSNET